MEGGKDFTSLFLVSLSPSLLLMSHSAVFKVNIFTAPLITRTSGTALPTLPTPSHCEIKYSYALPSSLSLLISPLPNVFNPHIMSFLVLSLSLMLFHPPIFHISILQLPYLSAHMLMAYHTLYTSVMYVCVVCVSRTGHTLHAVNTSDGSDVRRLFSRVYFSRSLARMMKELCSTS